MSFNCFSNEELYNFATHWGLNSPILVLKTMNGSRNICLFLQCKNDLIVLRFPVGSFRSFTSSENNTNAVYLKEIAIHKSLLNRDIPVVKWMDIDISMKILPLPYIIMEYVHGFDLNDAFNTINYEMSKKVISDCVRVLVEIHKTPFDSVLCSSASDIYTREYWLSVVRKIRSIGVLRSEDIDYILQTGFEVLEQLSQAPKGLVHGDYWGRNIISDPNNLNMRAIIDFEACHWGFIEYDLIKMRFWTLVERDSLWRQFIQEYYEAIQISDIVNERIMFWQLIFGVRYYKYCEYSDLNNIGFAKYIIKESLNYKEGFHGRYA